MFYGAACDSGVDVLWNPQEAIFLITGLEKSHKGQGINVPFNSFTVFSFRFRGRAATQYIVKAHIDTSSTFRYIILPNIKANSPITPILYSVPSPQSFDYLKNLVKHQKSQPKNWAIRVFSSPTLSMIPIRVSSYGPFTHRSQ